MDFRNFLEGPVRFFRFFCVQGAQKRSSSRATEGTLNTQIPEQASKNKGQKKHINFFNINFLDPPKTPHFGPQKKVYVPHFLGKSAKEAHKHKLFLGILGVKNGVPNGPFSATKSLVYCFFPALKEAFLVPRRFLEGPFEVFRIQGAQKRSSNDMPHCGKKKAWRPEISDVVLLGVWKHTGQKRNSPNRPFLLSPTPFVRSLPTTVPRSGFRKKQGKEGSFVTALATYSIEKGTSNPENIR